MKRLIGVGVVLTAMLALGCAAKQNVETAKIDAVSGAESTGQKQQGEAPEVTPNGAEQEAVTATASEGKIQEPATPVQTVREEALEAVHFDFDSYLLRPEERELLTRDADRIRGMNAKTFVLEGHCDERGDAEYNLALGDKRARAVFDYLTTLGLPQDRFSTVSYGKEHPLDPSHDETAWMKNRRVEIIPK